MIKPSKEQLETFYNEYTIQRAERNIIRYSVADDPLTKHLNPENSTLGSFPYHFNEIDDDDTITTYNIMRRDDLEVIEENVTLEDVEAFIIGEYADSENTSGK